MVKPTLESNADGSCPLCMPGTATITILGDLGECSLCGAEAVTQCTLTTSPGDYARPGTPQMAKLVKLCSRHASDAVEIRLAGSGFYEIDKKTGTVTAWDRKPA